MPLEFNTLCKLCSYTSTDISLDDLSIEQWEELWRLSIRHKVGPLLASRLNSIKIIPPESVASAISKSILINVKRGLQHSAELAVLTELFNSAGIAFLSFKGLALMDHSGLDLAHRHIGDMDLLLINPEDLIQADQMLLGAGYQRLTLAYSPRMTSSQKKYFLRFEKDVVYLHRQKGIKLELHFKLFPHESVLPITTSELYDQRSEFVVSTARIPMMSKRDHQVYLLLHGSFAAWFRLKWLCDLPLVSDNGVDFCSSDFERRIRELGVERPCFFGLKLANHYLAMPISAAVQTRSKDSRVIVRLINHAEKSLNRKEESSFSTLEKTVYVLHYALVYQTRLTPKISTKVKLIKSYLTRVDDWEVLRLPGNLFWLYYLLRPVFWLIRQLKS